MGGHQGAAARQAGWLFAIVGVIGLVNDVLASDQAGMVAYALDLAALAVGLAAFVVPWDRWSHRLTLVLPLVALAILGMNLREDLLPPSTFGLFLVLVFVWVGQWHRPGIPLAMGPAAIVAFVAPLFLGAEASSEVITGIAVSVPVAVLVGETIARKEVALGFALAGQEAANELLAAAILTDDLTGLGNRRRANALLESLEPGDALVILDLDHFKLVNDTYGHGRGDELLHELGVHLLAAVRDQDSVARFGGEEFVLVVRGARDPAAIAGRLVAGWRATNPLATLSAGVAVHGPGRTNHDTFAAADAALYRAKEGGRDRVVVATAG
jgi:diguanylate cyclase (GGDEF)-like protein